MELGDDFFITHADQHPIANPGEKMSGFVYLAKVRHKKALIQDFIVKVVAKDQEHFKAIIKQPWFMARLVKFAADEGIPMSPEDREEALELMRRADFARRKAQN